MNQEKFTQKSLEALSEAQNLAIRYRHTDIKPEHLALALIGQPDGLIPKILGKMGHEVPGLIDELSAELDRMPKVEAQTPSNLGLNPETHRILLDAEDAAKKRGDSYISVEHLFSFTFIQK